MTPQERAYEAQTQLARMVHAKATLDDVAVAVGHLIGAGVRLVDAVVAMVGSWTRLAGGAR